MNRVNIYAPNLTRLFETFDNVYKKPLSEYNYTDDYLIALKHLGIIISANGMYDVGAEWQFMLLSGTKRTLLFKKTLTERNEVECILETIGNDGKSDEEIEKSLKNHYASQTIRTFLAWLEILGILQLSDNMYKLSNQEEEEDIQEDYPSLDEAVNIKEDKYSIYEYLRKLKNGNIILSPDFQRHEVWRPVQKSKFMESVLMGLPLPPIYLKKDSDTRYIIVDGLQRTSTLRDFMEGKLQLAGLEPEGKNVLNGATIDTLDNIQDGLRARIEDRQLFVYVMEPSVPMAVVYDVFNRINTGGTQLTRQEIRNCIFQGNSTQLIKSVAENILFKESIDYGIQALRMKDREAVLRCLAFVVLNYELDYDGSMDKFLEKAMSKINKMSPKEMDVIEKRALKVFSVTKTIFDDTNFRIPTGMTRGRINIAVMESVFHCFYQRIDGFDKSKINSNDFRKEFGNLLDNHSFREAVRWSTGSTAQVKTRFRLAHKAFDNLLQ